MINYSMLDYAKVLRREVKGYKKPSSFLFGAGLAIFYSTLAYFLLVGVLNFLTF